MTRERAAGEPDDHQDIREAIKREKLIKKWKRDWKLDLIEKDNREWVDLAENW